ncbi:sulfotransferase [Marinobacter lacisalsi]|uniref:Sulfotransferase n=1 Tax=Marinobacter lacisalsi TaxID=475979 RepID=A0ABV8QHP3_9GAMM
MNQPVPTPLNILVAGIYWSGSGAVVDYLKGHPECWVPKGEFTDFKRQGRLGTMLESDTVDQALNLARRTWLETALGKLPAAWWKQRRAAAPNGLPLKDQVFHHQLKLNYLKQYRQQLVRSGQPGDATIWNQWLRAVGQNIAGNRKAVVWNQPIWVGKHEHTWPGVFEPYRLIVVHRNPEDQFAEVVRQGKIGKRKSDPAFDDSETDDVAYVLKGIANKYEALAELHQLLPEGRLLSVNFEAFVQDHDRQASRICQFLGLDQKQLEGAPFKAHESARNIGIGQTEAIQKTLSGYRPLVDRLRELRASLPG